MSFANTKPNKTMKTVRTYRKHTAAEIVAAAKAKPQWTKGGNLIATMEDGDIAFAVVTPKESNRYAQEIVLLNCMSIRVDVKDFGSGVAALEIDDEDLETLEALEETMWEDLNP